MMFCKTALYAGIVASCFAAQSLQTSLAQPAPSSPGYKGVYMVINPRVTPHGNPSMFALYAAGLANPMVDGATIIITWSDLYSTSNPGAGNYNWTELDNWLSYAIAANKKISLGVAAGVNAPSWILSPPYSVPAYRFTFNSGPVANADCVTMLLPASWGSTYVGLYDQMIVDLSAHLRATGAYNALKIVKLDGLNLQTQELGIGATRPADYNCPLQNSQYLTEGWAAAGFTPNAAVAAWGSITQTIAAAFPNQVLSVDVLASDGGFPSVSNAGQILAAPASGTDLTTQYMISSTLLSGTQASFANRFSVQWDALSNGAPDPEVLTAQTMGAKIAWQMNDRLGGLGAGCMVGTNVFAACQNPATFQSMLDYGINLGGQFIEIMAIDVVAYSSTLIEPHARLAAGVN